MIFIYFKHVLGYLGNYLAECWPPLAPPSDLQGRAPAARRPPPLIRFSLCLFRLKLGKFIKNPGNIKLKVPPPKKKCAKKTYFSLACESEGAPALFDLYISYGHRST